MICQLAGKAEKKKKKEENRPTVNGRKTKAVNARIGPRKG